MDRNKKQRIEELVRILNEASEAYYNDKDEIMSNFQWDALFDELTALEEETGYKAGKIEHLIDIFTTVAFCDEKISIYVATDLIPSKQNLDEDEFINVESYKIEDLIQMIYDGKIQDSKTVSGLMTYYHKYCCK